MLNKGGPAQQQAPIDPSRIASVRLPMAAWNTIAAGLWELPGKIGVPLIRELEGQLAQQVPPQPAQNNAHSEALTDE